MSVEIIPAILSDSIEEIQRQLAQVRGLFPVVQIDVVDGRFAPNKTWPYVGGNGTFEKLAREEEVLPLRQEFDFEIDLMVKNPGLVIPGWVKAGASRVVVHLASAARDEIFGLLEEWGHAVEIGLAVLPDAAAEDLTPYHGKISFVQCMGIARVGFQGQRLDDKVFGLVRRIKERLPDIIVSIDGGVNLETAPLFIEAGADRLVVGSAIFKSANVREAVEKFLRLV